MRRKSARAYRVHPIKWIIPVQFVEGDYGMFFALTAPAEAA